MTIMFYWLLLKTCIYSFLKGISRFNTNYTLLPF
uniref:Uncharacterized protein n=1 Tax=Arundo donax TaxID=35708 RepID=A0A0A9BYM7_ARUDO